MNRFEKYLQLAEEVLANFRCNQPLATFLSQWFAQRPQLGSRDRKYISRLCYQYFRLGNRASALPLPQRLRIASLLDEEANTGVLQSIGNDLVQYREVFNKLMSASFSDGASPSLVYNLSNGLSEQDYSKSMLEQPDLFLRIRPGHEERVKKSLASAAISYVDEGNGALRLQNATKLPDELKVNKHYVVQDLHSQTVIQRLRQVVPLGEDPFAAWDCCAGSGGKGILLHDLFSGIQLLATDIRQSILHNLKQRFVQAGITHSQCRQMDLEAGIPKDFAARFDLVLADVPCTGSGTWARTPEQLYCFEANGQLDHFAQKQFRIASAAADHVKHGGWLVYITCSVFRQENEEVVERLVSKGLQLHHSQLLDGTRLKCDSMFLAVLQKPRS